MNRFGWTPLWVALALGPTASATPAIPLAMVAQPSPPDLVVPADEELVEEVLVASEVDRDTSQVNWSDYFGNLVERIRRFILLPIAAGAESVMRGMGILAWILIWSAALALALWLTTWLVGRWRKKQGSQGPGEVVGVAAQGRRRDAGAWRLELDRRLRQGQVPEALEAAWWWLARSVAGHRVQESWTSRELVARVGRRDLSPWLAALDGMAFGGPAPEIQEVRAFVQRLEAALS